MILSALKEIDINYWQNQIGFLPQEVNILNDTVKSNIIFSTENKNMNNEENSLNLIALIEDTFDIILERNKELNEALDKLDMLSVDLIRRDVHRKALIKIEELEQEILQLKSNQS